VNAVENPIDRLLARGLTGRDLVSYMLPGIVWLAEHQDETFRLCYHDMLDRLLWKKLQPLP